MTTKMYYQEPNATDTQWHSALKFEKSANLMGYN